MNPPPTTKHAELSRVLRAEIAAGQYGVAGRLPSEAQLVQRFEVSRPTVAQALRTLCAEGVLTRRAGAGTFVQQPDKVAASRATRMLALLLPDFGNTEIFQLIAGDLASFARHHNYTLIWGGSTQPRLDADTRLEHGEELCRSFVEQRVDGVFFAPYELMPGGLEANIRMVRPLRDAGIPVVLIDHDLTPFPARSEFDLIGVDNIAGGYILGRHLLKLGCKRFCYVARPHSAPTIHARINGLREAIHGHGNGSCELVVEWGDVANMMFANKLMGNKPDVIACGNDHTAAVLLQSLARLSVAVPGDVKLVGFDDASLATLVTPTLTTVRQPCREIALAAFRAMMARLSEPAIPARGISLMPSLMVRESCGAYDK